MVKTRYNFLLAQKDLEKWQKVSEEYGLSVSSLIRLSVKEYIKKKEKEAIINQMELGNTNDKKALNEKIDTMMSKIEEMDQKKKTKTELNDVFKQRDRLKSQTIAILGKFPEGLSSKELSELLALDRVELDNFLLYMVDEKLINKKKGIVTLRE